MAKKLILTVVLLLAGTVVLCLLHRETSCGVLLSLAIVLGTTAYHIAMRLLVGLAFNTAMGNKANCEKRWYRVGAFEMSIYKKLKVRKWKRKLPSYDSALFDPRIHSWDEIAQAMCQAELVHETIVVLSFLPIVEGVWFGEYLVFIATSLFAAAFDMLFVMAQRYNRQRIMRLRSKTAPLVSNGRASA